MMKNWHNQKITTTLRQIAVLLFAGLGVSLTIAPGQAQVTANRDSTATTVTRAGNRFDISGGQRSRDGSNLFYSLQEFGLTREQIANFLSTPEVQNILTRINGGNPSLIDGLIRVTGGNANLYLLNPSGIIFGANARLDIPAAFTATTATGIEFGDRWFESIGDNNYANLVSNPTGFVFRTNQPGAIVNAGNLTVNANQSITLLGGTVVNTGTLSAPGGQITIAAIPGESRVRLSQAGMLLSLEVTPTNASDVSLPSPLTITPLTLPQLLTGGTIASATQITVNADGTIRLIGSDRSIPVQTGTAIASGRLDVSTPSGLAEMPGEVAILGDRVALVNATVDASGENGGGVIRIGGDYQGAGTVPNATYTYVDANSILNADARTQGNGGRIITWANDVTQFFGSAIARGGRLSGSGGFIEISGRNSLTFQGTVRLDAPFGQAGTILFDPRDINIVAGAGISDAEVRGDGTISFTDGGDNDFQIGSTALRAIAGNITLQATRDINLLAPLTLPGTNITFTAGRNFNGVGQTLATQGGNLNISAVDIIGNFQTSNGAGNAGDLTLTATGRVEVGQLDSRAVDASFATASRGNGGAITVRAGNGITVNGNIASWAESGNGNDITLITQNGDITFTACPANLCVESFAGGDRDPAFLDIPGNSGNIILRSENGSINSSGGSGLTLNASTGRGRPGNIELFAANDLVVSNAWVRGESSSAGDAGNITLRSNGTINLTGGFLDARASVGQPRSGGTVLIEAARNITTGEERVDSITGRVIGAIDTSGQQGSGTITLRSGGTINTAAGSLVSSSEVGNAGDITFTAPTINPGNILATGGSRGGTINFDGAVELSTDVEINTNANGIGGDVTFNNTVTENRNLSITADTGTVRFQNDVSVNSLEITSAGSTIVNGDITTANQPLFINSPVTIGTGSATLDAGTGDVDIRAAITATNRLSVLGNNITLADFTGTQLTAIANNAIAANGDVNSDRLNLTANSITLAGAVNSDQINLTTNDLAINNVVTTNGNLLLQPGTSGRDITLGAERTNTLSLTQAELSNLRGTGLVTIGQTATTGNIAIPTDITFSTATSLVPGSNILLNSDITTTGQNLTLGNILLGSNSTISTGTQGNLTLNGTVNSRQNPNYTLSLNAGNELQINQTIGEPGSLLRRLSLTAAQILLGGDINVTSGNLIFNDPVTLTDAVRLRSLRGNIRFRNTLDSTTIANDLTLAAPQGTVLLAGQVGSATAALGDIRIARAQTFRTTATLDANSLQYRGGTRNVTLGGDVTTRSLAGVTIETTGNIRANTITTNGGRITLQSDRARNTIVTTGNLNTASTTRNGGATTLEAGTRINTGTIDTSSTVGDGGDVSLDPDNNIEVEWINADGARVGGDVSAFTGRFFRATGSFVNRDGLPSSISASGGDRGGQIVLSHFGGAQFTPFIVGNATTNGTAAAITTGDTTIAPVRVFPGSYFQGNSPSDIQILTQDREAFPPINPPASFLEEPETDITIETIFTSEVATYLGEPSPAIKDLATIQRTLSDVEANTGVRPAIIYVLLVPRSLTNEQFGDGFNVDLTIDRRGLLQIEQPDDQLLVVVVTPTGKPIVERVPAATRTEVIRTVQLLQRYVSGSSSGGARYEDAYLEPAQQVYQWVMRPILDDLEQNGIENLTFALDAGLRSLPIAALHSGEEFLAQDYSVGLIPSMSLTDTTYTAVSQEEAVLAMGASDFSNLTDLEFVPLELAVIRELRPFSQTGFLNTAFTIENLIHQQQRTGINLLHLATHAEFDEEQPEDSYIQFFDQKLRLSDLGRLRVQNLELLVLSACHTALGDREAELGFAGVAFKSGAKTVIASLWYVSDEATTALMAEFYAQLGGSRIKAEALQAAQQAFINAQPRRRYGELLRTLREKGVRMPDSTSIETLERRDLSHPYYWSAFTIVGNPW